MSVPVRAYACCEQLLAQEFLEHAKTFLEWLKVAEEEDDSEEEEEQSDEQSDDGS